MLLRLLLILSILVAGTTTEAQNTKSVSGTVRDADSGNTLPCRLYVQSLDTGTWHFATSADPNGGAVEYRKDRGDGRSAEMHTCLTPHPFTLQLPPGRYRVRAEHGKEFVPAETEVTVTPEAAPPVAALTLKRFSNLAARGWFSGDIHVHRALEELPVAVPAEDLNVALPLTYWVHDSRESPAASGPAQPPALIELEPARIIHPVNTEYEIFTVNGQRHTLGAVLVLNHRQPLTHPAPPVQLIAEEARRQQALLDLDKHSWNWSLMIIPVMNVDLFELSNNHHWRTQFGFPQWTLEVAPDWPEIERDERGFTERGWTEFGMQTYYALLNCGQRLRVSGGTASGVHPVPLGHGRVYVFTGQDFSFDAWMKNLNAGHSFVTTGPLIDASFDGELPGTTWSRSIPDNTLDVQAQIDSLHPLKSVELIVNGVTVPVTTAESTRTEQGTWQTTLDVPVRLSGSGWIALRCFENLPNSKVSFAHTNPVFIDVTGYPLTPRRRDAEDFVKRMDEEIARNTGVLPDESVAEYRRARAIYAAALSRTSGP
jgi:hypothetical protein